MASELRILVTGGGTGGHTLPALATVEAIKELAESRLPGRLIHFLYVGSEKGLEARLAKEAGIDFVAIATGKLRRASTPIKMFNRANLVDALRVPLGFFQALQTVKGFRPDVVFSTGGYVSIPAVFAAKLLGIPIIMHEQTVQIGLANRWSARIASRIALSYAESAAELSSDARKRSFVTGGVVRKTVLGGDSAKARLRYGFDGDRADLPVVYITGGAMGSSVINRSVLESMAILTSECCIIHQCGRQREGGVQDEDLLREAVLKLPEESKRRCFVTPFIGDEIGDVYALADLIVGRSGAGTVGDACAVGKATVFIPLVPTGGDEQTKNAQRMVSAGASMIIKQSDVTGPLLSETIISLLRDRDKLKSMGDAATKLSTPDAARVLADAVLDLALSASRKTVAAAG